MKIGDFDIPEDWETMTCIYECGFILIWERKSGGGDVGDTMERHLVLEHSPSDYPFFQRFYRKGKHERDR